MYIYIHYRTYVCMYIYICILNGALAEPNLGTAPTYIKPNPTRPLSPDPGGPAISSASPPWPWPALRRPRPRDFWCRAEVTGLLLRSIIEVTILWMYSYHILNIELPSYEHNLSYHNMGIVVNNMASGLWNLSLNFLTAAQKIGDTSPFEADVYGSWTNRGKHRSHPHDHLNITV